MTHTDEPRTEPAPDDPRKPASPADLKKPSWKLAAKGAVREFMDDECTDLAAALTYYAVLAAAPALLALVSLLGFVGDAEAAIDSILTTLSDFLPEETLAIVQPLVANLVGSTGAGLALVVGLVIALWSASGYVTAFGRAMNRVYEVVEGRPIWKLRPLLLLVTLIVVVLAAVIVASLVLSGPIARSVGEAIGLGDVALTVWNIAKWPVAVLLVVVVVALLYHLTPNVKQPKFRWISVGAVVAIVAWAVASAAFGFYVANFGSYGSYGMLGTVIVFLLWLWITNLALLFGAELDAELERSRELQGGIAAEETIQLPPRDTKASDKKAAKRRDAVAEARGIREAAARDRTGRTDAR
ncbi:YihY/virulence factor BrkB family protein [Isoptericola sp. 4D.3]|uniref:YihY/virulence factor BrkB family protein n=1 Tax=Isoptericola peretonis TaxID=2918523 RepID=A0ABT0J3H0_9MICO|nr:YihY/virulence factor BrkB family protein [Isoptericola sp. 4D.3]